MYRSSSPHSVIPYGYTRDGDVISDLLYYCTGSDRVMETTRARLRSEKQRLRHKCTALCRKLKPVPVTSITVLAAMTKLAWLVPFLGQSHARVELVAQCEDA